MFDSDDWLIVLKMSDCVREGPSFYITIEVWILSEIMRCPAQCLAIVSSSLLLGLILGIHCFISLVHYKTLTSLWLPTSENGRPREFSVKRGGLMIAEDALLKLVSKHHNYVTLFCY